MLVGLSAWSDVQIVCIWSGRCQWHFIILSSLASVKFRMALFFWYRLTQIVREKKPSGVKLDRIPSDLRSGTSYLRSTTCSNRSCTPQLRSDTFLLTGFTTLYSLYLSIFLYEWCFVKKNVVLRGHLHLSMLGVDRCCKHQTLFKCHKSQTECLECSAVGNPTLLLAPRARASVSCLQGSTTSCWVI